MSDRGIGSTLCYLCGHGVHECQCATPKLSNRQILESAQDWLEWFRESANPLTADERWECLDDAAVHLELVLGVLERLLPDAE